MLLVFFFVYFYFWFYIFTDPFSKFYACVGYLIWIYILCDFMNNKICFFILRSLQCFLKIIY